VRAIPSGEKGAICRSVDFPLPVAVPSTILNSLLESTWNSAL